MLKPYQRKSQAAYRKKKYAADPDFRKRSLEANKRYRERNKDTIKLGQQSYRERNKERMNTYMREYIKDWYPKNIERNILYNAKKRAKSNGLDFNLTIDDIVIPLVCPVYKVPLVVGDRRYAPSLDRINNSQGYVKGNVVIVSRFANEVKRNATIAELKQLVDFYEQYVQVITPTNLES